MCMRVCMFMYMYMHTNLYMYVYVYMYMYVYVYIHTHTSISQSASPTAIPVTLKAHAPQSAADEWIRGHARYPEGCTASGSVPSQSSA